MYKLNNIWQKNKITVLVVATFAAIYITVGCLWFLAPNSKYFPDQSRTYIEWIVPILGWATYFLNFPPYVFVPILAIAGVLAGLITKVLLTHKNLTKLLGIAIGILLAVINFYVGLFLYIFTIMIW